VSWVLERVMNSSGPYLAVDDARLLRGVAPSYERPGRERFPLVDQLLFAIAKVVLRNLSTTLKLGPRLFKKAVGSAMSEIGQDSSKGRCVIRVRSPKREAPLRK